MRIYCIPTKNPTDTEQIIRNYYKLYCEEKGLAYNPNIDIIRAENGKPYFESSDIHFSLSHTNSLTVICFAPFIVGIDCEKVTRKINHLELIKEKVYSRKEKDYANNDERFIEIWVKKEAYSKYTGNGLSDIRNFDTFSLNGEFNLTRYNNHIICTYHE